MDRNESFSPGYCEYLVPGNVSKTIVLIRILSVVLGIAVIIGVFSLLSVIPQVFFIWFVVAVCLEIAVFRLTKREFEYSVVMGEMNVDVIYGRRFRKRLISVRIADADRIFPVENAVDKQIERLMPNKIINAAPRKSEFLYCLYTKDTVAKNTKTAIIFSTCSKLSSAIKFYNRSAFTERK